MKTKLQRDVWRIEIPEELVAETGFSEGEALECRAFPGGLSLLSQSASAACTAGLVPRTEKNFAAGAEAFLLWIFPAFSGQRAFASKKWESQGAAGTAGL